ncbi:MAG: hypothetical protein IKM33_03770 [Clostridia bacterium]|nr:hypothetical protein [Clostridia bacterium]
MAENQNKNQSKAMDSIKKGLEYAADLTSLKFKLSKAKSKRKDAFTRLGELSYTKYRPRTTDIPEDIENAISAVMGEINTLNHEITELELRIKILKAGV